MNKLEKISVCIDGEKRHGLYVKAGIGLQEALQKISDGKATKVFLPYEASGVLGSIAGIGELLKEKVSET